MEKAPLETEESITIKPATENNVSEVEVEVEVKESILSNTEDKVSDNDNSKVEQSLKGKESDTTSNTNSVEPVENKEKIQESDCIKTASITTVNNNSSSANGNSEKDVSNNKVNGSTESDDAKDLITSPIQSPCEIENMTVVDEDVEMVSSEDDEKSTVENNENVSIKVSKRKITTSESDQITKKKKSGEIKETIKDNEDTKNDKTKGNVEKEKPLPLLEKYWKAVKQDPTDFTGWTYLLQYVDQANNVPAASEVYDDFLSRYPYCYGYWRKYADYLKKNGCKDKCSEIFERGIKAIPLSVDLWIHFLNFTKENGVDNEKTIRDLFERSVKTCGLEFRSDRLWDSYVKWETEQKNLSNVTKIYDRWLAVPTQGYVGVLEKFKEHVKKNSPNKILDPEEFFNLRDEVLNENQSGHAEIDSKISDDAPPGEETPEKLDKMNEEETKAMKEKIMNKRKETYKKTQKEASARWTFEENIKRPYFHVKPLEQSQLENWKKYLDFEIKEGNYDRVVLLFERCLIACALYEELWLKFLDYLLAQKTVDVEKTRDVFVRACTTHHPKKLNIHLKWATFEETYGNSAKAASILETYEKLCPNLLIVILRRLNVIRRRGEYDLVCSLYEKYIDLFSDKKDMSSNLSIKYARFCSRILNDIPKAVEILKAAVEKDKTNLRIVTQLIDTLMCKSPIDTDEVVKIMDEAISMISDIEKKLLFAQRKVEFLEEFSEDCLGVQKAQEYYEELSKTVVDKKKVVGDKKSDATKNSASGDQVNTGSVQTSGAVTSGAPTYYQTTPQASGYQAYPQGYVGNYAQQQIFTTDPSGASFSFQNWTQPYGYGNQQWMSGTNPQQNAGSGYGYMY